MAQHSVLLIRSDNLAWSGLREALEQMRDVYIVGDTAEAAHALELAARVRPELVVTGAAVRGSRAPAGLLAELRQCSPQSRIVMIVDRLEQVCGFDLITTQGLALEGQLVWSEVNAERFHRCICTVLDDGYVVASREAAAHFIDGQRLRPSVDLFLPKLTIREREVLPLVAQGETGQSIARGLGVRPSTVDGYVARLCDKLEAKNRPHLVDAAWRRGLLGDHAISQ